MDNTNEIRERLSKINPTEWYDKDFGISNFNIAIEYKPENINFIANAPEDIVFLLDEVEAKDKRIAELDAELKRYRKAEEDGRLIELPCKIGDALWIADGYMPDWAYILYFTNNSFECKTCMSVYIGGKYQRTKTILFSDIGKTVFLTRGEAENKLLKEKENG